MRPDADFAIVNALIGFYIRGAANTLWATNHAKDLARTALELRK
jgi:hypothetical protein